MRAVNSYEILKATSVDDLYEKLKDFDAISRSNNSNFLISWHPDSPHPYYRHFWWKNILIKEDRKHIDIVFVEKTATGLDLYQFSWEKGKFFCERSVPGGGNHARKLVGYPLYVPAIAADAVISPILIFLAVANQ